MKKLIFLIALGSISSLAIAQDKCSQVIQLLDQVKDACQAYPPQDYCNIFVGQAISDMYQIDDFKLSASPTGFYDANSIVLNLFTTWSANWQNLGTADSQDVLNAAQNVANSNKCVIAVWRNPNPSNPGHICLILPGQLTASGTWGLNVPNSANFAMNAPANNYVCDKLSKAFRANAAPAVYLFVHN